MGPQSLFLDERLGIDVGAFLVPYVLVGDRGESVDDVLASQLLVPDAVKNVIA